MGFTLFKQRKQATQNEHSLIHMSKQMEPSFHVTPGSDLDHQLQMLDLNQDDFAIAQALKPYIEEEITVIVDRFYKNLEYHPSLINIINENSSMDRLKKSLRSHIIEMFSGIVNEKFLLKRKKNRTDSCENRINAKMVYCLFSGNL